MDVPIDIVTVTLNPAIDRTVFIDRFAPGSVNRVTREQRLAGGKGVNVSALLGQFGIPNSATGFLGRDNQEIFVDLFTRYGIEDAFLRLSAETRTGIKIIDGRTRETTDINFPGMRPSERELDLLEKRLGLLAEKGRWFVIGGSLPDGISVEFFAGILSMLKQAGAHVAVDTSGHALRAAIDGGVDVIKPNEHELAEYLGKELPDLTAKIAAAVEIQKTKVPHVILSLGGEGALFITPGSSLMVSPPPVEVVGTVGAGDALLAGYLAGLVTGRASDDRARLATVFAWSVLENVSRELPSKAGIEERMSRISLRSIADLTPE
jgi:1-phosphofructokinase